MFPESGGFVAMPVTSCKEDEIVGPCDRRSNETVTLRNHVNKYKNMRKRMVEFLRKFENRGTKISRIN